VNWLRRLFNKSRTESDLDRELRFHLEEQVRESVNSGMSAEEAYRRARQDFGGLERVKEEVRDVRWETRLQNIGISILQFAASEKIGASPPWRFSHWR
jgi:hypothetical protein